MGAAVDYGDSQHSCSPLVRTPRSHPTGCRQISREPSWRLSCSYRVQLQAQCSARWQKVSLFILHCNSFRPNNNKITELAVLISGMADSCSFSSSVLCITAIQQQLEVSYAETSISASHDANSQVQHQPAYRCDRCICSNK